MSFEITQVDLVDCDIERIVHYYNQFGTGTSKKFLDNLYEAAEALAINPFFQVKYKIIRTLKVKNFPYLIHYIVDEKNKKVVILAIAFAGYEDQDFSKRL